MLRDKTIVISGASAGIGRAIALHAARQRANLVLGARRVAVLEDLAHELKAEGARDVLTLSLDVQDSSSVQNFAAQTLTHGTVDVLVNNAGLALGVDTLQTGNLEDWQTMIDTNVMGVLRLTRAFLPAMAEKKNAHIVMMGSIAGHFAYEGGGVYCATKHALQALTKTLKLELCGTGLRVTSIDPGMVNTEFSEVRFKDPERAKKVYEGLQPLTADDIAECVIFAISRPAHVNIDSLIVMPTAQATVYKVHRT